MQRSAFAVWLVFLIFFVISLVTNILGSIIPNIIEDFELGLTGLQVGVIRSSAR